MKPKPSIRTALANVLGWAAEVRDIYRTLESAETEHDEELEEGALDDLMDAVNGLAEAIDEYDRIQEESRAMKEAN